MLLLTVLAIFSVLKSWGLWGVALPAVFGLAVVKKWALVVNTWAKFISLFSKKVADVATDVSEIADDVDAAIDDSTGSIDLTGKDKLIDDVKDVIESGKAVVHDLKKP